MLFLLCKEILLLCLLSHIHLVVRHIPGTFNVLADCLSRFHNPVNTVGTTASSVRFSCSTVGSSSCRSLCHQSESQTGNLCISSFRSSVLRSRRHVSVLGRNVRLRLSSVPLSSSSASQDQAIHYKRKQIHSEKIYLILILISTAARWYNLA